VTFRGVLDRINVATPTEALSNTARHHGSFARNAASTRFPRTSNINRLARFRIVNTKRAVEDGSSLAIIQYLALDRLSKDRSKRRKIRQKNTVDRLGGERAK
jgi:hypothetical protein